MRIAVISTSIFQLGQGGLIGYGGLEQIAWQTAKGLAAKGHEVALIAPEGSYCPGCRIISTGPAGNGNEKLTYGGYWQHLLDFDVIVDNSWQKHAYILKMEGKLKAPILGVCHAPINTMYQSLPPVEKPCFVCISQDQANHFQGLFSAEARVCHNGISLDYYKPLGIPRTNRFLFLARFSKIKGPDIAIEACKAAGVGLDLVGDTSITNEPELYEKCRQLADGEQIRIVGPCNRGESVWWFSQAHAMIHPTKTFREPFGLAPVESMACETPVIAWDFGALRETVGTEGGILVKSFDALVSAIKKVAVPDYYFMHNSRMRAREQASKFSVENMVARYEELCVEALNGGW